jgi:hypothetical protein
LDTDFARAFAALVDGGVEFVIVGGLAATVHGSARLTHDLDIVYARSRENLERLARALEPYAPYLRGVPPGLPFVLDRQTLERGLNFTLVTRFGPLDLLGDMAGVGGYEEAVKRAVTVSLFGRDCRVVSLDTLIRAKKAAGRPKDLEVIAELESLRDLTRE